MAIKDVIDHFDGKTTTYEGGVGYHTTFKETLAEFFSLGLLNGKFYQSQEEVLSDAVEIYQKALSECPEFASKCAVYGAEKNSLKLVPVLWLVYLSTLEDKTLFNKVFPRIIRNVSLLHDFMELCRKTPIRKGLGRSVKKAVNNQLHRLLNEYSASRNKGTIREIVKVTRPHFTDEQFQNYMKYVIKDELAFERARELKRIIEKLKRNEIDNDTLETITRHSFQLEELKHAINNSPPGIKGKILALTKTIIAEKDMAKVAELQAEILALKQKSVEALGAEQKQMLYKHLYKGLRYAALMLNLVALERVYAEKVKQVRKHGRNRGGFGQDEVVKTAIPKDLSNMVQAKIESVEDYRASKILPFTLINAHRMVKTEAFKQSIANILFTCAHEAFDIPEETEILVAVDTSGSMRSPLNDSLDVVDVASFLGALITCSHEKTTVCSVADHCEKVPLQKEDNLFKIADAITGTDVGGSTHLGEVMHEYRGQKYLLLLTDSEAADNLESKWLHAKKPDDAKLIVWQLQAYKTKLSNHRSVIYFAGFSDRLLELLKRIIEDRGTQLEEIEAVVL